MKRYAPFQAPFLSFFCADFYRDVAKNWSGIGALYLMVLIMAIWLVSTAKIFLPLTAVMAQSDSNKFIDQFPKMIFKDGKVSMDRRSPYELKDPDSGVVYVVFDLQSKKTSLTDTDPPVLIREDAAVMRNSKGQTQEIPWKSFPDGEFDSATIKQMIRTVMNWAPVVYYFGIGPFIFVAHLLQALIYGGIAKLIASMMEVKFDYAAGVRLAIMAMTPAILISTLIDALFSSIAGVWMFASIIVVLGYIFFAVQSLKSTPAEETQPA